MRGTTRDPARADDIEAAGAEPFIGDPDRLATLVPALEHVAIVCLSAHLHGPRLEALLWCLIDTTARGVVYEGPAAELVRNASERSHIPCALLDGPKDDHQAWLQAALAAVESLL